MNWSSDWSFLPWKKPSSSWKKNMINTIHLQNRNFISCRLYLKIALICVSVEKINRIFASKIQLLRSISVMHSRLYPNSLAVWNSTLRLENVQHVKSVKVDRLGRQCAVVSRYSGPRLWGNREPLACDWGSDLSWLSRFGGRAQCAGLPSAVSGMVISLSLTLGIANVY